MRYLIGLTMLLGACNWYVPDAESVVYHYEPVCKMPFDYSPFACYENCCHWDTMSGEEVWCSYDDCTWTFRDALYIDQPTVCEETTVDYSWYVACQEVWCLYPYHEPSWYFEGALCCDYEWYPAECWYEY